MVLGWILATTLLPNGAGVDSQCTPRRDLGNWALHGAQVVFFWFNLQQVCTEVGKSALSAIT